MKMKSSIITPEEDQIVQPVTLQDAFAMLLGFSEQNLIKTDSVLEYLNILAESTNSLHPLMSTICYGLTKTVPGFKEQLLKRMYLTRLFLLYRVKEQKEFTDDENTNLLEFEKAAEMQFPGFVEKVKNYYQLEFKEAKKIGIDPIVFTLLTEDI